MLRTFFSALAAVFADAFAPSRQLRPFRGPARPLPTSYKRLPVPKELEPLRPQAPEVPLGVGEPPVPESAMDPHGAAHGAAV